MSFTKLAAEIWRAYVIDGNVLSGAHRPIKSDIVTWGTELESSFAISTPPTNDGAALGSTSLKWSDLFLASGAVINFNGGDITITHTPNNLLFSGASVGYAFDAIVYPTTNDAAALGSAGNQWSDLFLASGAVISFAAGDVSITHAANNLLFAGASVGYAFDAIVYPTTNDAAALGSAGNQWSDLFLASGGVLNFGNSNGVLTHVSGVSFQSNLPIVVPDDTYNATSWNGNTSVPTKNAIRDKIETITAGGLSSNVVNVDYDLSTPSGTQDITGFGFNPLNCMINSGVSGGSGGLTVGYAVSGGVQGSTSIATNGTTCFRQAGASIFYSNAAGTDFQYGVVSFITDGIRITWTRVGAPIGTLGITILGQK